MIFKVNLLSLFYVQDPQHHEAQEALNTYLDVVHHTHFEVYRQIWAYSVTLLGEDVEGDSGTNLCK